MASARLTPIQSWASSQVARQGFCSRGGVPARESRAWMTWRRHLPGRRTWIAGLVGLVAGLAIAGGTWWLVAGRTTAAAGINRRADGEPHRGGRR